MISNYTIVGRCIHWIYIDYEHPSLKKNVKKNEIVYWKPWIFLSRVFFLFVSTFSKYHNLSLFPLLAMGGDRWCEHVEATAAAADEARVSGWFVIGISIDKIKSILNRRWMVCGFLNELKWINAIIAWTPNIEALLSFCVDITRDITPIAN